MKSSQKSTMTENDVGEDFPRKVDQNFSKLKLRTKEQKIRAISI